jgi:hypothetical protein
MLIQPSPMADTVGHSFQAGAAPWPILDNSKNDFREDRQWLFPLGDIAPDFEADTTQGRIRFHDWNRRLLAVLFLAIEGFQLCLHNAMLG